MRKSRLMESRNSPLFIEELKVKQEEGIIALSPLSFQRGRVEIIPARIGFNRARYRNISQIR